MYSLTLLTTTTPSVRNLVSRSPLRLGFLLVALALVWFALSPTARAVTPAPDGSYANGNTAECTEALFSLTGETDNTAIGNLTLHSATNAIGNTAIGGKALYSNTASYNTATGYGTLYNNSTGIENTAHGFKALLSNTTGTDNTAVGYQALYSSNGNYNTAIGSFALQNNNGGSNTASGYTALFNNTSGSQNTATGYGALYNNTTAGSNTASGAAALQGNTTGNNNVALGYFAGSKLSKGGNNIDIGANVVGLTGEANTIRIGKQGTQKSTVIAGIFGTAVSGSTVVVNSSGKLGVAASSARFKEAIKPMDKTSEAILALKPVTFRYKEELDPDKIPQFGLIAEDVEKVNPDLVVRDEDGKVNTVRYEAVNAMLLNEFLKEHRMVQELKSIVAKQEATAAQQQTEIKALTASVRKVSDQVALSKPAPQLVANP